MFDDHGYQDYFRVKHKEPPQKKKSLLTTPQKWLIAFAIVSIGISVWGSVVTTVAFATRKNSLLPAPASDTPANARRASNYLLRVDLAAQNAAKVLPTHTSNGDETFYALHLGSFSKGLTHDSKGQVDPTAFATFVQSLEEHQFERIPLADMADRKLANPQAALAFDLMGGDGHSFTQPPAPAFNSSEMAAEYVENAWMAVLRDVPFDMYATNPVAVEAANELDALGTNFTGPRPVTSQSLFRGLSPGCLTGPYLSQFFYLPMQYGYYDFGLKITPHAPGVDFMTDFSEYLNIQNGKNPSASEQRTSPNRYMINGRDLANWVHVDIIWQAYHMASLSLFTMNAPFNPTNPYLVSNNQAGFATFGVADIVTTVQEVAKHALHAVWYQKWFVHRRLRPEVFGARIHVNKTTATAYPIDSIALNTAANDYIYATHGSYLLPQAYPEGSPMHPSYGAGHGTVAGACVTVLKAFFDEEHIIENPVEPNAAGSALNPYTGGNLTVGGELNKLGNNVAIGRNIAGVHWRSDATESLLLGERVAIDFLRDYKRTYYEPFTGWKFTSFQGVTVQI